MKEADRFMTNFEELEFLDENGKPIQMNSQEYFKQRQEVTCWDELAVGDIVRIKKANYHVQISQIKFYLEDGNYFDYAGHKLDSNDEGLVLFNQADVECKISQKSK